MSFSKYKFTCTERFLRYVQIDTQSDPNSALFPSTEKQKNLGKLLVQELLQMGISDAHMDEYGYVYATLPSNTEKDIATICFCSHMDTSPDCSGENVKPVLHKNYQGECIEFADDETLQLNPSEHPDLLNKIGHTIITASGKTLLGADNKAGIAEIMDAVSYLLQNPEIKHGDIRILFTPDEEIGRGVDKVDMVKLNAQYGYTIDGETLGHLENETFSADGATLTIYGVSTHPGFAKNKMIHAVKIASEIVSKLPIDLSPENTEKKEPFIHPVSISGGVEICTVQFILRAFDTETLGKLANLIDGIAKTVIGQERHLGAKYNLHIQEQYRNMKEILDTVPFVTDYALEAIRRAGITPHLESIRGGTDGSRLSFMGLPCPNIFAGEHAFHSKVEWISEQDMQKAVETIVNLAAIWEEKG